MLIVMNLCGVDFTNKRRPICFCTESYYPVKVIGADFEGSTTNYETLHFIILLEELFYLN